jgi:hypothetical protein
MEYAVERDYKLVYRLDDDITLEPDNIEKIFNEFVGDNACLLAAVGGMIYNPSIPRAEQQIPPNWRTRPEFAGDVDPCCYWAQVLEYPGDIKERTDIKHLYSSYMYRPQLVSSVGGFPSNLSPVASREETIPLYELWLQGNKLKILMGAVAFHHNEQHGGCRSIPSNLAKEAYSNDELAFRSKIKELNDKYMKK